MTEKQINMALLEQRDMIYNSHEWKKIFMEVEPFESKGDPIPLGSNFTGR